MCFTNFKKLDFKSNFCRTEADLVLDNFADLWKICFSRLRLHIPCYRLRMWHLLCSYDNREKTPKKPVNSVTPEYVTWKLQKRAPYRKRKKIVWVALCPFVPSAGNMMHRLLIVWSARLRRRKTLRMGWEIRWEIRIKTSTF